VGGGGAFRGQCAREALAEWRGRRTEEFAEDAVSNTLCVGCSDDFSVGGCASYVVASLAVAGDVGGAVGRWG
jgi:hypothetical protein